MDFNPPSSGEIALGVTNALTDAVRQLSIRVQHLESYVERLLNDVRELQQEAK